MANDYRTPGEDTVDRLMARGELEEYNVPGHGRVLRGPLADRALTALGGEYMTVDGSIVVPSDFDPSNPEHMAGLAHEEYHRDFGSGEGGTHHIHDAEEAAAYAVQRMVLHRMEGGYEGGYQPGAGGGRPNPGESSEQGGRGTSMFNPQADDGTPESEDRDPDPTQGYGALISQGYTHEEVVLRLAEETLKLLDAKRDMGLDRHIDKKGNF